MHDLFVQLPAYYADQLTLFVHAMRCQPVFVRIMLARQPPLHAEIELDKK